MRVFAARNGGDRGAVMVEMAIVVPIFILLVFGMLEFGLAFKNKLTMAHATNQATRRATVLGSDAAADIATERVACTDVDTDACTNIDAESDANANTDGNGDRDGNIHTDTKPVAVTDGAAGDGDADAAPIDLGRRELLQLC